MFKRAITLPELIIALILAGIAVLGAISFEVASREFFRSANRRVGVLNQASLIMDHITKNALRGIGDVTQAGNEAIQVVSSASLGQMLVIKQDTNGNGRRDANNNVDNLVGYARDDNKGEFLFCTDVKTPAYSCAVPKRVVLSSQSTAWSVNVPANTNYAEVSVGVRYDRTLPSSADNPEVILNTTVSAPGFSLR